MKLISRSLGLALFALLLVVHHGDFVACQKITDKPLESLTELQPNHEEVATIALDSKPWVVAEYNGSIFKAPLFDDKKFSEGKVQLDRIIFKDMKALIEELSRRIIKENQSIIVYGIKNLGRLRRLFDEKRRQAREFAEKDSSPRTGREYGAKMGELLSKLSESKSDTYVRGAPAHELVLKVLNGIEAMVNVSPTGLYLDWRKMMIDEQTLPEYVGPLVQGIRGTSRRPLLSLFPIIGEALKKGI